MTAPASEWHLYLIRAADGSLYTGIALDVDRRMAEHAEGGPRAAKYLRSRGALELAYTVRIGSRALALRAEHRVKQLSKPKKEELIAARLERTALLEALSLEAPDPAG